MAKAAAKRRRLRAGDDDTARSFVAIVASEFVGVSLLGLAALATLALATYSAVDPVFELTQVTNRAGVVGASLAGGLIALLGHGSVVFVAATAFLGVRLVLGQGAPSWRSRFWIGASLLVVAVATLPPLLDDFAPGRLGTPVGGMLGDALVEIEVLLLSLWGALLVNGLLFVLGALSVTGISTGAAIGAIARAATLVGHTSAAVAAYVFGALRALSVRGRALGDPSTISRRPSGSLDSTVKPGLARCSSTSPSPL